MRYIVTLKSGTTKIEKKSSRIIPVKKSSNSYSVLSLTLKKKNVTKTLFL